MTPFLKLLCLWGILAVGFGDPPASNSGETNPRQASLLHPQSFVLQETPPYDLWQPQAPINFVKIEDFHQFDLPALTALTDQRIFYLTRYSQVLRSAKWEKYPWQITCLFPFHEFT